MKKIVKTFGNGIGIYFDREDREAYNLELGDIIDVDIGAVKKGRDNDEKKE